MIVIIPVLFLIVISEVHALERHAYLVARNDSSQRTLCAAYYPQIVTLPVNLTESEFHPVANLSSWEACSDHPPDVKPQFQGKFVIISGQNCSLEEKINSVQELNATGMLIVAKTSLPNPGNLSEVDVAVVFISSSIENKIMELGTQVQVAAYAPQQHAYFDWSLFMIWCLAMFTIVFGSYCSGTYRYQLHTRSTEVVALHSETEESNQISSRAARGDEVSLQISPLVVVMLVVGMCVMIVLLYFFFQYLVYLIIGLFCIGSSVAMYTCIAVVISRIHYCGHSILKFQICSIHCTIWQLFLAAACMTMSVFWAINRHATYAWILQDIMGIFTSVYMLVNIRLPSFRICTYVMGMLFVYDIFFVFITPFFTKGGKSVMVEVATGGDSGEMSPMVFLVAYLDSDVCLEGRYSMLGFGDVLVPGLLISFCYAFDLCRKGPKFLYFGVTSFAYGIGLFVTFAGLYFMSSAQPALLYLVPFTLLPVFIISLCRGEFQQIWNGDMQVFQLKTDNSANSSAQSVTRSLTSSPEDVQPVTSRNERKQEKLTS